MSEGERLVKVPEQFAKQARIGSIDKYRALYDRSLSDPDRFWAEQAERITWFKKWDKVSQWDFHDAKIGYFLGGKLNASVNCLDRHLNGPRKNKAALIWEGDSPEESRTLTYQDVYRETCKFANGLKALGVKKGDRVTIYLPMVPELAISMLACARIGAIHSVVFGGFSAESLKNRILDCKSDVVITADGGYRGGRIVPLKITTDEALKECPDVKTVVVLKRDRQGRAVQRGPRPVVARHRPHRAGRVPAREDGRRGPALHPLYERLDRKAQGRDAHHRRVHGLHLAHPQATSSTCARRTRSGAPPTSAGSPATATSSTGLWRTARPA